MARSKLLERPAKKAKAKASPETADDFQEAADLEEDTGGKWRAGDPAKSGRAFVRALDAYDQGLQRHPTNFDLAYNKARLQLDITQQPALITHIGLPLVDLLQQTLLSHRYALRINDENADLLFNSSQVLTSLAEHLSEDGQSSQSVHLLQEALELLSSCLARQEMMLEQQQIDLPDEEDEGGVVLLDDHTPSSTSTPQPDDRMATVVNPVTPNDLLDTVHASLSALTTLLPLADENALGTLGDMARSLTDTKGPTYISLLPADAQSDARFTLHLDRANFVAAYSNAQYTFHRIELTTYIERLQAYELPDKYQNVGAMSSEAEARVELVLSAFDQQGGGEQIPAIDCWKQLALSQDLLTRATKLNTDEAKSDRAKTYKSKGDIELLRFRLASLPSSALSESIKNSGGTLLKNARTYYKGALDFAKSLGDDDTGASAAKRSEATQYLMHALQSSSSSGMSSTGGASEEQPMTERLSEILLEVADEGLIDANVLDQILNSS